MFGYLWPLTIPKELEDWLSPFYKEEQENFDRNYINLCTALRITTILILNLSILEQLFFSLGFLQFLSTEFSTFHRTSLSFPSLNLFLYILPFDSNIKIIFHNFTFVLLNADTQKQHWVLCIVLVHWNFVEFVFTSSKFICWKIFMQEAVIPQQKQKPSFCPGLLESYQINQSANAKARPWVSLSQHQQAIPGKL